MNVDWSNVSYDVRYGDLSIVIEQWDETNNSLVNLITMHTSETRNGIEFPFKNKLSYGHYR